MRANAVKMLIGTDQHASTIDRQRSVGKRGPVESVDICADGVLIISDEDDDDDDDNHGYGGKHRTAWKQLVACERKLFGPSCFALS